jgi:hypothetical protein
VGIGWWILRVGVGASGGRRQDAQHDELAGLEFGEMPTVGHYPEDDQPRGDFDSLGDDGV